MKPNSISIQDLLKLKRRLENVNPAENLTFETAYWFNRQLQLKAGTTYTGMRTIVKCNFPIAQS